MKISFIVPVYNVEKYLDECVQSILNQSFDDYEIILVNDGSPDNCPAMCVGYEVRYPKKIRVVHKKNEGPSKARNYGMDIAKGEYLFFMDGDDFLCEDRLAELYEKAVSYNADIVHTGYFSFDEASGKMIRCKPAFETEKLYFHQDMEKELCYTSSKSLITFMWRNLYKKEFLYKNHIRLDENLRRVEDPPFNMEAFSKAERFVAVDIPVLCYRIRDNSLQRQEYVPDYDKWLYMQWGLKLKHYSENCTQSPIFYEDIGEYTIKAIFPMLLGNVYKNKRKESFEVLKRLGESDMMRRSFRDYDIQKFKSKSLDWRMTWFVKNKMYLPAHLMCKYILYK
ncbi:MAG: glycosyltransferase family 2 protein [Clostridia bacterium]|nr:glycosyltransferase family 2 protein [Clostridia bacterium]